MCVTVNVPRAVIFQFTSRFPPPCALPDASPRPTLRSWRTIIGSVSKNHRYGIAGACRSGRRVLTASDRRALVDELHSRLPPRNLKRLPNDGEDSILRTATGGSKETATAAASIGCR